VDWTGEWDALVFAIFPVVVLIVVRVAIWHIDTTAEREWVIAGLVSGKGFRRLPDGPHGRDPAARRQWRVVVDVTWPEMDGAGRAAVCSIRLDTIDPRLQAGAAPPHEPFAVDERVVDLGVGTPALWGRAVRDAFTGTDSPWWDLTSTPASLGTGQHAQRRPPPRRGAGPAAPRRPGGPGTGGA
jgi:hypothetical protein